MVIPNFNHRVTQTQSVTGGALDIGGPPQSGAASVAILVNAEAV